MDLRRPFLALAAVAIATLSACASMGSVTTVSSETTPAASRGADTTTGTTPRGSTTAPGPTPSTTARAPETTIAKSTKLPTDAVAIAQAAVADVQTFWATEMPKVYAKTFAPLAGGAIAATSSTRLPACGGERLTYRDIQDNALYCPQDDFILYDTGLVDDLNDNYGANVVATVIAHEFGHSIQNRAGVTARTIILELQADCFAGAWASYSNRSASSPFRFGSEELDATIGGFLEFRDEVGIGAQTPGAHGNAFDRVGAFQDGYESGAGRCAQYLRQTPTITEIPFTSPADFNSGGNLPYDQILSLTFTDLDRYWKETFAAANRAYTTVARQKPYSSGEKVTCGSTTLTSDFLRSNSFYCAADDMVAWDNDRMESDVYAIGDFAVSLALSNAWSDAMLTREKSTLTGKPRILQEYCYTGSWVGDILRNAQTKQLNLQLSPGDLDEGVTALLTFGGNKTTADQVGTSFERVGALRKGLQQGIAACRS